MGYLKFHHEFVRWESFWEIQSGRSHRQQRVSFLARTADVHGPRGNEAPNPPPLRCRRRWGQGVITWQSKPKPLALVEKMLSDSQPTVQRCAHVGAPARVEGGGRPALISPTGRSHLPQGTGTSGDPFGNGWR